MTSLSGKKKLLGVVWQTATMSCIFQLFGDLIGIDMDMMKHGINTLLFSYFSVAMNNENRKGYIACEGILHGEWEELHPSSPGCPLTEANAVTADRFFDQALIVKLDFVNTQFILDHWHLLDSGLMIFGKSSYELMHGRLIKMIKT
jgi:hypothetical protein